MSSSGSSARHIQTSPNRVVTRAVSTHAFGGIGTSADSAGISVVRPVAIEAVAVIGALDLVVHDCGRR